MTALTDSIEAKPNSNNVEADAHVRVNLTCGLTEVVRGSERQLIDEFRPAVERQTVSLDFRSVERIDAAGMAALISLYRIARESGHGFELANVTPRVRELLGLVGLEAILVSHNAESASALVQSAA